MLLAVLMAGAAERKSASEDPHCLSHREAVPIRVTNKRAHSEKPSGRWLRPAVWWGALLWCVACWIALGYGVAAFAG